MSEGESYSAFRPESFYQLIYQCNSATAIEYITEDHLKLPGVPQEHRSRMNAIIEAATLDERWALACDALGKTEEAAKLRLHAAGLLQKKSSV